jgi:hypothetical protein
LQSIVELNMHASAQPRMAHAATRHRDDFAVQELAAKFRRAI